MVQYWWVNQTRNYQTERLKELVAGEINMENKAKTHWGRKNVKNMNIGDFIVCYRSRIGIDRLAYVTEGVTNGDEGDLIPWDVFNWDEIPGVDNGRLMKYLMKVDGIDWGKNAKIEKINNNKIIKVSTQIKSLSLELNDPQSEVVSEIDGHKIKLIQRMENGKRNIYQENCKYRRAYIAKVNYINEIKPIPRRAFWDVLSDSSGKKEPIDLIRNQIRYAYAMNIKKNAFFRIMNLAETVNPGITTELEKFA
ncbi:MAG: hypothetical protein WCW68_11270 [Methanothrix sp.]